MQVAQLHCPTAAARYKELTPRDLDLMLSFVLSTIVCCPSVRVAESVNPTRFYYQGACCDPFTLSGSQIASPLLFSLSLPVSATVYTCPGRKATLYGKMLLQLLVWLGCIPWLVHSLASTDETSDADPAQSGYLPNHNMQPSIVGSSSFVILWTKTFNVKELWYAKPVVHTPPGQKQLVFTASNQNWIRTFDAVTGTPIQGRQVIPPVLQSDIGCTDMPNTIGK